MPVAETNRVVPDHTSSITPKSALRHRPIDDSEASPSTFPATQRRASRAPRSTAVIDDIPEWKGETTKGQKRSPAHETNFPAASSAAKTARRIFWPRVQLARLSKLKRGNSTQISPWLYLGVGMTVMLVLVMLLSTTLGWFITTLDTIRYGYPRTYQVDAWVGHHEDTGKPSHFIAINLNRHIEIIEIAGDDPGHTRIFDGPVLYGPDGNLTPVTLRFVTPPGKKYPNMIVQFGSTQLIYLNENGTFVSQ
jgi:hypothetical protein